MIRKMIKDDAEIFYSMTEKFYASDAVLHSIPSKHHIDAFNEIMRSDTYLEGFIFEFEDKPVGYALIAKMYSHEAGGITLWIDEIYVLDEFRSKGLGREFFKHLNSRPGSPVVRLRLEVEPYNEKAIKLYKEMGFDLLEYQQMYKDID